MSSKAMPVFLWMFLKCVVFWDLKISLMSTACRATRQQHEMSDRQRLRKAGCKTVADPAPSAYLGPAYTCAVSSTHSSSSFNFTAPSRQCVSFSSRILMLPAPAG